MNLSRWEALYVGPSKKNRSKQSKLRQALAKVLGQGLVLALALLLAAVCWFVLAHGAWAQTEPTQDQHADLLVQGRSFFTIPWVAAPSSTTARDGLGPLFNANTCVSCHQGRPIAQAIGATASLDRAYVVKLSQPSRHHFREAEQITVPDPVYGYQVAINAINGVPFEAKPRVRELVHSYIFNDGEQLRLRSWEIVLNNLNYGDLAPLTQMSLRVAPPLWGLAWLEALSVEQLVNQQAQQKKQYPQLAGELNQVYDPIEKRFRLGRLGWKAAQASLLTQTADAAIHDMGLRNLAYPQENCTAKQEDCLAAPRGRLSRPNDEDFDLTTPRLQAIAYYVKHLDLPAKKSTITDSALLTQGKAVFQSMQCAVCHQPEQKTTDGRLFAPFSDFLLHDMGPALADQRPEFAASTQQWRTAPLWRNYAKAQLGLGFLHDGRARNVLEAIAWHGGQASQSREAFRQLTAEQREALLAYLESL